MTKWKQIGNTVYKVEEPDQIPADPERGPEGCDLDPICEQKTFDSLQAERWSDDGGYQPN